MSKKHVLFFLSFALLIPTALYASHEKKWKGGPCYDASGARKKEIDTKYNALTKQIKEEFYATGKPSWSTDFTADPRWQPAMTAWDAELTASNQEYEACLARPHSEPIPSQPPTQPKPVTRPSVPELHDATITINPDDPESVACAKYEFCIGFGEGIEQVCKKTGENCNNVYRYFAEECYKNNPGCKKAATELGIRGPEDLEKNACARYQTCLNIGEYWLNDCRSLGKDDCTSFDEYVTTCKTNHADCTNPPQSRRVSSVDDTNDGGGIGAFISGLFGKDDENSETQVTDNSAEMTIRDMEDDDTNVEESPPTSSCKDSDGDNIASYGFVEQEGNRLFDGCRDLGTVIEAVCINGDALQKEVACPDEQTCSIGRCRVIKREQCTDPDADDAFRATTVKDITGSKLRDFCHDDQTLVELSCAADGSLAFTHITCGLEMQCIDGRCRKPQSTIGRFFSRLGTSLRLLFMSEEQHLIQDWGPPQAGMIIARPTQMIGEE